MRCLDLKRLISVMIFDLPLSPNFIPTEFSRLHEFHQVQDQHWPFWGTHGKMAAEYWFCHVLASFGTILTGLWCRWPLFLNGPRSCLSWSS